MRAGLGYIGGMSSKLTHVALHVRDVEASRAFYEDYCGLSVVHERTSHGGGGSIYWMAAEGQGQEFVIVILPGGARSAQPSGDFTHLGIALDSEAAVEAMAERARAEGILAWPVHRDPYPVGTYCGVYDPDGAVVEFSYGQPLG